jgi:cyanate permease
MNTMGNLGQVVSVPLAAWLAMLAGEAGRPSWKVSLYFYAAMFFAASVAWVWVDPRRVILYSAENQGRPRRWKAPELAGRETMGRDFGE